MVDDSAKTDMTSVVGNARLTALNGAVLFVLLGLIGITVLRIRSLLPQHLLLGFVLIPPLGLKLVSTGYRLVRYYSGDRAFRLAGPPRLVLRLIAPVVVLSTLALFVTGLELWLFGLRFGSIWVEAHKASFFVWLPFTAIHVLAHLDESTSAAGAELSTRPPGDVFVRRSLVVGGVLLGIVLGVASLAYASPFIFFGDDR